MIDQWHLGFSREEDGIDLDGIICSTHPPYLQNRLPCDHGDDGGTNCFQCHVGIESALCGNFSMTSANSTLD